MKVGRGGPIAVHVRSQLIFAAGAYASAVGALTLLGRALHVPHLMSWGGAPIVMKVNAALCLIVSGAALVAVALGSKQKQLIRSLALLVALVGGLALLEHLTAVNVGIDTLLFHEAPGAAATTAPGRMGPPASLSFLAIGTSLWLLEGSARARRWASALAIVPFALGALGIIGYLYGASELYALARFTGIALETATSVAALGIGLIAAVPEHGIVVALRRDDPGGVMFRRMLVPLVLVPVVIGWLRVLGQRAGIYDVPFGTATRTTVEILLLLGLLWWTASGISRHAQAATQAERALREANRRKDDFLAILAHELRNPLAPLRTGLEIIAKSPLDQAAAGRARAMMDRQLSQMVHLVDDLLDINRISRGKIELRIEQLEVRTLIESAVETSRPVIDGLGHELVIAQPSQRIFVKGDLTRLAQVIANLLNNAAKYTEPGGRIEIRVESEGDTVRIGITDNGVGISADTLPTLFEMFTQAAGSLDRSHGGLGIGLALVKQLVEMHGGRVEAYSPPRKQNDASTGHGKGTEVIVRLPVVAVETADAVSPDSVEVPRPPASPATPSAPLRVLIADDNVDAANSLSMLLDAMGHETRVAYDGREALEAAAAFRPDVAMLDIGMPELSGYEIGERIRAEPWGKSIVLIALTGWGRAEDRRRSADAGFDHHLVKPADFGVIQKLLPTVGAAPAVARRPDRHASG